MLRPGQVTIHEERDGDTVGLRVEGPRIAAFSEKAIWQMQQHHPGLTPERIGYRRYDTIPYTRMGYYARPLALWLLLSACVTVRYAFWGILGWLHEHGVFHLTSQAGVMFRWRDVRPGRRDG